MKLWEVLKALEENPNKVFECNLLSGFKALMSTRDGYFDLKIFNCYGELIPRGIKGGAFNENIRINGDWHEVKQPVTWQEAIQAWADGKTIRWEDREEVVIISGFQQLLEDVNGPLAKYQITSGTWYIED